MCPTAIKQFHEALLTVTVVCDLFPQDIPEGGSKAVVLVDTTDLAKGSAAGAAAGSGGGVATTARKEEVMRKCVKAFTDAMLDLIVDTDETRAAGCGGGPSTSGRAEQEVRCPSVSLLAFRRSSSSLVSLLVLGAASLILYA